MSDPVLRPTGPADPLDGDDGLMYRPDPYADMTDEEFGAEIPP